MAPAVRPWCAEAVFPGKKKFIGGTLVMPSHAQHHEVEAAMMDFLGEMLPSGFTIIKLMPGALFFQEET
ncbi:hypothetical protein RCZAHN_102 [Rhodobacter phage RcZahn]|nr:hypothetical protein RCZAHN_102 [Rhodobacter phage RcZahn]